MQLHADQPTCQSHELQVRRKHTIGHLWLGRCDEDPQRAEDLPEI